MTTQRLRSVPSPGPAAPPPEPDVTLPLDGRIDLGGGDWVKIAVAPTTAQFFAVLDAFDALQKARFEESIALAERQAAARKAHINEDLAEFMPAGTRAMFEFSLAALAALAVDAAVKGPDGHETAAHDLEALRQWPLGKVMKGGRYALALKDRLAIPGI